MTLTNQQKILASILGVGLSLVIFDRLVLLGPETSEATATAATDAIASPAAAEAVDTRPQSTRLAELFTDYSARHAPELESVHDAFAPPDAWGLNVEPLVVEAGRASLIRRVYPLRAIMLSGGERYATVGDRMVRVGDTLEGFRVLSIDERSVVLRSGVETVTLELDESNR